MRKSLLINRPVKRRKKTLLQRIGKAIQGTSYSIFVAASVLSAITAISILFVSLYQYLLGSPYFKLTDLNIEGTDPRMRQELIQMAGLDVDTSTIELDLEDIKQRMEIHPWVKSVQLKRDFPHALHVKVERHVPIALVNAGTVLYMDETGEIFKELEPGDDTNYPVITGIPEEPGIRKRHVSMAIGLLETLRKEGGPLAYERISEIHIRRNGLVSIYLMDMRVEIKCAGSGLMAKIGELRRVLNHLNESGRMGQAATIDLNYDDGVAVSFRKC